MAVLPGFGRIYSVELLSCVVHGAFVERRRAGELLYVDLFCTLMLPWPSRIVVFLGVSSQMHV
jgi:hypothetical protein